MNIFEKFLNNISYKFPKGYPDINNEQDISLLENIVSEVLGQEIVLEQFRTLSYSEIAKTGRNRAYKIAKKIEDKEEFELTNNRTAILQFAKPEYKVIFQDQDLDSIRKIGGNKINSFPFFQDSNGSQYSLSDILKTSYFGGKGVGSGTKVEDANLLLASDKLNKAIEENNGKPITVIVGPNTYKSISSIKTQFGFPKSDFNLYNTEDQPVVFISHKKGGRTPSSRDFIRWSGFTDFATSPDVEAFNKALIEFLKENDLKQLPNNTSFVSRIKDKKLLFNIIYGKDFGGSFGPNNVQIIIQGDVLFEKIKPGVYKLTGSHVLLNGDIPEGEYYPYLMSKYRSDRAMFGIPANEAIASTETVAKSASNVYELKNNKFVKIK
jgi:hypothetical protein